MSKQGFDNKLEVRKQNKNQSKTKSSSSFSVATINERKTKIIRKTIGYIRT